MALAQWLDIWQNDYLGGVKPRTAVDYANNIRKHIKPALGAVKLETLAAHTIQQFYNDFVRAVDEGGKGLSPKTLRNVHLVLHKSLQQAVMLGYIRTNPADACALPRITKSEIKPLDEDDTARFLQAIKGHRFEIIYLVTLFTGMRKGEVFGLTWDCVDFAAGTINLGGIHNEHFRHTSGNELCRSAIVPANSAIFGTGREAEGYKFKSLPSKLDYNVPVCFR